MRDKNKKIHFAWWVLVGLCVTVGLSKGALNGSAGLYLPSVSKDLDIGMGNLTLYLSIAAFITMFFLPMGGKVMARFNPRLVLSIAIILQAGSFAAFGFMSSIWGWYVFAVPLAIGGIFTTVIAGPILINSWFRKKNGLALGILGAAGGAIGAVSQPVVGHMITGQGWRFGYIALGAFVIIAAVPTILLLLRKSPYSISLLPYGAKDAENGPGTAQDDEENAGIIMKDAKKSLSFYALLLYFFMITAIVSFAVHIPTYITNNGYSVSFAGNVMGFYMIGVLFGSLVLGYFIDKTGSKLTTIVSIVVGIVSVLLLIFFVDSKTMIGISIFMFGFVSSNAINILAPALTTSLFGKRDYSRIYSTVSMGLAVGSVIALPIYGYIFDIWGSYKPVLYGIIMMMVLNIILILLAFHSKKKLLIDGKWK